MKNQQYLEAYLDESSELLEKLDSRLVEFEASGDGVDELFRIFHTLKGSSASMGFERVALLSHRLEDILGLVREGKLAVSSDLVDFLLQGADGIRKLIAEETEGGEVCANYQDLLRQAEAFLGDRGEEAPEAAHLPSVKLELTDRERKQAAGALWKLSLQLAEDCPLKGARSLLILKGIEELGKVLKSHPAGSALESESYDGSLVVIFSSSLSWGELERRLTEKVLTEVAAYRLEQYDAPKQGNGNGKRTTSIRVEAAKLDQLLNLAGELVIVQAQLDQLAGSEENDALKQVAADNQRLIMDLQAAVMKARMVPLTSVFGRFPRLVRDLARELNKKVELVILGSETEVDRTVAEGITEPLLHLVRNAIDHGIERPELRKAKGKEETGRVILQASQEGEAVLISVEDDGAGIDVESVRRTALERGLVTESQLEKLSDHEIMNLIFLPGLSTNEEVTDVSGRGVGMDVVRSTIEDLGGVVSAVSTPGEGTKITIRLPLTLAIVKALLVGVGSETYAIPLSQIVELVRLAPEDLQDVRGQDCFFYDEQVVGLYDLAELLEVPDKKCSKVHKVVVIDCGQRLIGCCVDEFLGQQNIVVKAIGGYLPQYPYLGGATILGDGQVVLILDGRNLV